MPKYKYLGVLFVVFLLYCTACSDKNTNSTSGRLTGNAFDLKNNQPLSGVELTVADIDNSATTDIHGEFTIYNIPAGVYTLYASKSGYQPQSIQIQILENKTSNIGFYLSRGKSDSLPIIDELKPFALIFMPFNKSFRNLSGRGLKPKTSHVNLAPDRFCRENSCAEFGTSPVSKISFDYNEILNQTDFSFCYWIYINDIPGIAEDNKIDIISRWGHAGKHYQTYAFGITTDFKPNYLLYSEKAAYSIGNIIQPVNPNNWIHLSITYSRHTLKYYINGVKVFTTNSVEPQASDFYGLQIGSRYNVSTTQFSGKIDDFWMFSKALTDDEIDYIYNLK